MTVVVGAVVLAGFLTFLISAIATGGQKANRRAIRELNRRFGRLADEESKTPGTRKIDESDQRSDSTK